MPTELIGEFGTPGATSEWTEARGKLAIRHLKKICGDPPPEMELEKIGGFPGNRMLLRQRRDVSYFFAFSLASRTSGRTTQTPIVLL
jgi:hypothetical protein